MILDKIENSHVYCNMHPLFAKAFDFIRSTDFSNIELGKHIIEGEALFAIVMEYDTQEEADCNVETHKKYIDIQYMIEGAEFVGIATLQDQSPLKPYDEHGDFTFYNVNNLSKIRFTTGQFALFYPDDMHQTMIQVERPSQLRKVVLKISKEYNQV